MGIVSGSPKSLHLKAASPKEKFLALEATKELESNEIAWLKTARNAAYPSIKFDNTPLIIRDSLLPSIPFRLDGVFIKFVFALYKNHFL